MAARLVLDSGVLGRLLHPRPVPAMEAWFESRIRAGDEMVVPEIADYELRRELIRAGRTRSLRRLDEFINDMTWLPLDTPTLRRAAELWAELRNRGQPTAGADSLDGDVILASQAESVAGIVVTDNPAHLGRMVRAVVWNRM